jgi:microcystin-dependent protein
MSFFKRAGVEIIRSAVIALVISSTFAGAAFWQWSQTPGSNATADPNINWTIGMAPSAVSGSSRSMMAQLAKYRDDVSGLLATSGTSTAYTVTSNQGLCLSPSTTPQDGQQISVTVNNTNGNAATLAADSCSAYPIQSSAGVAVGAGTMVAGSPYTLKYSATNSAWMLSGFYSNPYNIPIGGMIDYTGSSAPNSNFVLPYGQCISRTTYAVYFAQVGTTYGTCDGSTTFGVPDLRGRVIAGHDAMGGTSANRLSSVMASTTLGATGGAQNHALTLAELPTGITSANASQSITVSTGSYIPLSSVPVTNLTTGSGSNTAIPWANGGTYTYAQSLTGSNSISVTSNNTSGTAHPTVQPTFIANKLLRII